VIALQSIWQLKQLYGDDAEVLSDLFQIKIYGRHTAGAGAEDATKRLGIRKINGLERNRHPVAEDKRLWLPFKAEHQIFSATQLQRELGLFNPGTRMESIRAIVSYAGSAYLFDWPPTLWAAQSEGDVPATWTKMVALSGNEGRD
jgi:hypothetical protein